MPFRSRGQIRRSGVSIGRGLSQGRNGPIRVMRPQRNGARMRWWRRRKDEGPRPDWKPIFKVCLLGDAGSGKTQLLRGHGYSTRDDKYITTIGTKVTKKTMIYERPKPGGTARIRATFLLWDILGQKEYCRLHPVYFQGAQGAIVVSRAAAADAFDSFRLWARSIIEIDGPLPILFLLNGGTAAISAAPLEASPLCAEFPGSSFMMVFTDEASSMEKALTEIGGRVLDDSLAARPRFGA